MGAGQWKTLGKDRVGEPWLVLVMVLCKKKKAARMIGEMSGHRHSSSHPTVAFPCLEKGRDQRDVEGNGWRLYVKK